MGVSLEAYIDEEEILEDESSVMTLDDVVFSGKTLQDYEDAFTHKLPSIPCSGQEILSAISDLANAYQLAYNCASKLIIVCAKAEKDFKVSRNKIVAQKIKELRDLTPGKSTKLPAKETIEAMAIEGSQELSNLISTLKKWEMVKDWFDSHVKKLAQMLMSAKDISYAINNADRAYDRAHASLR